jgi:hypothetical protein
MRTAHRALKPRATVTLRLSSTERDISLSSGCSELGTGSSNLPCPTQRVCNIEDCLVMARMVSSAAHTGGGSSEGVNDALSRKQYAHDGERRHLTVLFCDLVDSTAILARLDPEEWQLGQ